MILGLCGYKGSGKDTVAAYLVKQHGFERKAFADPLKKSVAALLDIPFADVDKLKNNPMVRIETGIVNYATQVPGSEPHSHTHNIRASEIKELRTTLSNLTFREFLQRYGTESHRATFGENFWVDITLPVQGYYPGRAIVITDVRFDNEADRIKNLEGYIIWVEREEALEDSDNISMHVSENYDFPKDFVLMNNGSFDDLYEGIEELLDDIGKTATASM